MMQAVGLNFLPQKRENPVAPTQEATYHLLTINKAVPTKDEASPAGCRFRRCRRAHQDGFANGWYSPSI
jgi:hypothetical protein